MSGFVELGIVARPHGLRGDIIIKSLSGQSSSLASLLAVSIGTSPTNSRIYPLIEATWMPKGWKLKLDSIETEADAQKLRGMTLYAPRTELPVLGADQYYVSDLAGADVFESETDKKLGTFLGVESTGVHEWWVIKTLDGDELTVRAHQRYVSRVDTVERRIYLSHVDEICG